jgi:hypothetical protein
VTSSYVRFAKVGSIALAVVALVWAILQLPVEVPDANSPLEGNAGGAINASATLGQTLVANRNGINRVDVVLSTENRVDQGNLKFSIMEVPWSQSREVTRPVAGLPIGKIGDFRPGTIMQRWYSFSFEPIPDSAGKRLYFSLESKELPQSSSVNLLMYFYNEYPFGEAYINGDTTNAHVVFRTYAQGNLGDLIGVWVENLTRDRPGLLGNPATYGLLVLVYLLLAAGTVLAARKAA